MYLSPPPQKEKLMASQSPTVVIAEQAPSCKQTVPGSQMRTDREFFSLTTGVMEDVVKERCYQVARATLFDVCNLAASLSITCHSCFDAKYLALLERLWSPRPCKLIKEVVSCTKCTLVSKSVILGTLC